MDWSQTLLEVLFVLGVSAVVFSFFRKYVTPIKRLSTWLVIFIVVSGMVDYCNRFIAEAQILPGNIAHLPLQTLATSLLILFVPIREADGKKESKDDSKDGNRKEGKKGEVVLGTQTSSHSEGSSGSAGTGKKSHPPTKRRFRKK